MSRLDELISSARNWDLRHKQDTHWWGDLCDAAFWELEKLRRTTPSEDAELLEAYERWLESKFQDWLTLFNAFGRWAAAKGGVERPAPLLACEDVGCPCVEDPELEHGEDAGSLPYAKGGGK